jgi:hypothetical protein
MKSAMTIWQQVMCYVPTFLCSIIMAVATARTSTGPSVTAGLARSAHLRIEPHWKLQSRWLQRNQGCCIDSAGPDLHVVGGSPASVLVAVAMQGPCRPCQPLVQVPPSVRLHVSSGRLPPQRHREHVLAKHQAAARAGEVGRPGLVHWRDGKLVEPPGLVVVVVGEEAHAGLGVLHPAPEC